MIVRKMTPILAVTLFAACAPQPAADEGITTELILTNTPMVITPEITETPVPEPTAGPLRLTVWWPESLAPTNEDEVEVILSRQVREFERSQANINVELRLKQPQDVGGIMETLRTASAVAPGALPDLTLIQREDLMIAVQAGLVQPLEGRVSSLILGNFYTSVLALGQVNNTLYGLPYALEVQHLAVQPQVDGASWRFGSVLSRDVPVVFPANRINGVNDVFLVQYLDAGGALPEEGEAMTINTDALRDTLAFYEQAVAAGLVDPAVLDYSAPANYQRDLTGGVLPAAVVTSTLYLDLLADGQELDYGLIPTSSGQPATVLNGWMWVLTTPDADRQALAVTFLNWMLDAERQGQYDEVIHMIPSQRAVLLQWENRPYAQFIGRLLDNATLPLAETQGGAAARALQEAFTAVLLGVRTADEATQAVIDQLAS